LKAAADATIGQQANTAAKIGNIQQAAIDRQIAEVESDRKLYKEGTNAYALATAEIAALNAKRKLSEDETNRAVAAGRKQDTEDARKHAADLAQIEKENADRAQATVNHLLEERQLKERDIENQVNRGQLSEYVGKLKIIAVQKEYNQKLTEALKILENLANTVNDPNLAVTLHLQIDQIKQDLADSNEEAASLGKDQIKSVGIDTAISSFTSNHDWLFANGTKTAKEAFRDFALDVLQQIESTDY
jgi:hypothetical protein